MAGNSPIAKFDYPLIFNITQPAPIDSRNTVSSVSAISTELPAGVRFTGLLSWVQDESVFYHFKDGVLDEHFVKLELNDSSIQQFVFTSTEEIENGFTFNHGLGVTDFLIQFFLEDEQIHLDYEFFEYNAAAPTAHENNLRLMPSVGFVIPEGLKIVIMAYSTEGESTFSDPVDVTDAPVVVIEGPQGPQGEQGEQGPPGADGDPGEPVIVYVDNTYDIKYQSIVNSGSEAGFAELQLIHNGQLDFLLVKNLEPIGEGSFSAHYDVYISLRLANLIGTNTLLDRNSSFNDFTILDPVLYEIIGNVRVRNLRYLTETSPSFVGYIHSDLSQEFGYLDTDEEIVNSPEETLGIIDARILITNSNTDFRYLGEANINFDEGVSSNYDRNIMTRLSRYDYFVGVGGLAPVSQRVSTTDNLEDFQLTGGVHAFKEYADWFIHTTVSGKHYLALNASVLPSYPAKPDMFYEKNALIECAIFKDYHLDVSPQNENPQLNTSTANYDADLYVARFIINSNIVSTIVSGSRGGLFNIYEITTDNRLNTAITDNITLGINGLDMFDIGTPYVAPDNEGENWQNGGMYARMVYQPNITDNFVKNITVLNHTREVLTQTETDRVINKEVDGLIGTVGSNNRWFSFFIVHKDTIDADLTKNLYSFRLKGSRNVTTDRLDFTSTDPYSFDTVVGDFFTTNAEYGTGHADLIVVISETDRGEVTTDFDYNVRKISLLGSILKDRRYITDGSSIDETVEMKYSFKAAL